MSDAGMAAAQRIHAILPGLPVTTAAPIEGGWVSDSFVAEGTDGTWIVQIGRAPHEEDLRRQIAILPELSSEVSAPIPEPEFADASVPAMAYRLIPGVACEERADLGMWPERLGRFLYDLHAVPPEFVGMRARSAAAVRADVRDEMGRAAQETLPLLAAEERSRLERDWSAFVDDDVLWRLAPCLVHADLGLEHILVDDHGDLAGVIDWSDAAVGDPAWDFAVLLHDLPDQGERALAAYGGAPDAGFLARAAFAWRFVPFHEVRYGLETDQEAFVEAGLAAVRARNGAGNGAGNDGS
jgi:aminoglycoside phosphotransferase (APT) family kinase protein